MDTKAKIDIMRQLKAAGVQDTNIDLWLAIDSNDQQALKSALDAGADPNMTDNAVLARHKGKIDELGLG